MAQAKMMIPSNVVERNIVLVKEIMQYLLDNPQVFSSLPDRFELVVLPEDDPEMRLYNYAYLVPFIESEREIFLKTIIPSRKATKKYLRGQIKDE